MISKSVTDSYTVLTVLTCMINHIEGGIKVRRIVVEHLGGIIDYPFPTLSIPCGLCKQCSDKVKGLEGKDEEYRWEGVMKYHIASMKSRT